MRSDLDVIVKRYPHDQEVLRIYAIGDVHVGSREFNERVIKEKIKRIKDDPCSAVVLCGDLGDYGLKNSKTNVYEATMQPKQQQNYIYELFLPIKDRIIAAVPGNHEYRITREVGTCPLYYLCVRWDKEEVYRENVAIIKVLFGNQRGKKQQVSFIGVVTHGTTKNKTHRHLMCYDSVDFGIYGHCHQPSYNSLGRIRVSSHGKATHVPYKEIVVDANLDPGGYGLKNNYEIPSTPELQYLELSYYFTGNNRDLARVMDYHSIQI